MTQSEGAAQDPRPRRGFFANVGALILARAFLAVSQLLVLPIIARQLTVEEFALMALAMTVVTFANVLSDAGLGRSLIRTRHYDPEEWSCVFWLLVGVGILLCLGVIAAAPLWARFFGQPELYALLCALSVVPLFQALSATPNAEIERREEYGNVAWLQVVAACSGLAAAVGLALAGAGVWALVAQQVLLALVRLVGTVILSKFRPRLFFTLRLLGGHLRFALNALSVSLISVVQGESSTVGIGKFLGDGPLGYFAMSQRFAKLPQFGVVGPTSAVVYVRMAKAQDDPEKLIGIYLASSRLLATLLIPPCAVIAVAGSAIFTLLLSSEWSRVAPVFALSIPGVVLEAVTITCLACLFRAVDRSDLQVRLRFEGAILQVVLVLITAQISLEAVAASLTLWALAYIPRGWSLARTIVPLSYSDCLSVLSRPLFTAVGAVLVHVLLRSVLAPGNAAEVCLAAAITIGAMGGLAIWDRERLRAAVELFR